MNSITATNTNTTTSPYDTQAAKRLERVHSQLAGFATLAQVCRSLSEIHYTYATSHTPGLTERVMDIQTRFSEALTAAFPTPEALDELTDSAHEAIGAAVRAVSPPAPATVAAVEPDESPTTPTADPMWKAMLDAHNGNMRDAMTEAGYSDAGTDTPEAAMETATCWAYRLASIDRLGILIEFARTLYAQGRADGREPHEVK